MLDELIDCTSHYYLRGWTPATSSNFSVRETNENIAITISGLHKGKLDDASFLRLSLDGTPLSAGKPSAETALHLLVYNTFAETKCVLHTHSPQSTALSLALPSATALRCSGLEILKAFPGISTHQTDVFIPIFDNEQDMSLLAATISENIDAFMVPAFIIRGHGIYVWGDSVSSANKHLEAIEFIIDCNIIQRSINT